EPASSIDPTAHPLSDQAYVTDAPKQGYIYVCDAQMFQQTNAPGSVKPGDWIDHTANTYDVTKKLFIAGNVFHDDAKFTITTSANQRLIVANGLPLDVPTGVFPVSVSDPAYDYDPNPNQI